MSISKEMVENNDFATKREAYYVSKNWGDCKFNEQPESDTVMDDIEALAQPRRSLARAAALLPRGTRRFGRRQLGRDRQRQRDGLAISIDCTGFGSGSYSIPTRSSI